MSSRKRVPTPGRRATARVFWTGRSQAVRLPREFRFQTEEVAIHREGDRVVLEPLDVPRDRKGWPLALWQLAGAAPSFDLGERSGPHERGSVFGSPEA